MIDRIEDKPPVEVWLPDNQREVLHQTRLWVQNFFVRADQQETMAGGGHRFDHNQRVAGMAAVIASGEGREAFLPILTSLLFDLGRTSDDPRSRTYQHGELSVEMANDYIDSLSILDSNDRVLVKNAMADHPLLNQNVRESWLVKIIMDADRLDTIGALGPVRAAAFRWRLPLYTGEESRASEEHKLESIYQDFSARVTEWYDSLWTPTARQIAAPRQEFLLAFSEEFRKEAGFMLQSYRQFEI